MYSLKNVFVNAIFGPSSKMRRAQRPKVDSNEVLREFRLSGWTPAPALDSTTADTSILDAIRAHVRPRSVAEQHARDLCAV